MKNKRVLITEEYLGIPFSINAYDVDDGSVYYCTVRIGERFYDLENVDHVGMAKIIAHNFIWGYTERGKHEKEKTYNSSVRG